jgi:hypothetical protein
VSTTTPTPAGTRSTPGPADDALQPPPVVVGADGSGCGLRAVRWAAEEAVRRDAPLRIVHATPHLGRRGVAGSPAPELPRARGATAQAFTVARHTAPSVRVSTEVVRGEPVAALLRSADDVQRHCTSPMAFVPPVHRVTGTEPREESIAVGWRRTTSPPPAGLVQRLAPGV